MKSVDEIVETLRNGIRRGAYAADGLLPPQKAYRRRAVGISNAMLGLFTPDGRGTCGWVYPDRVNGVAAKGPDPLCNDQDWALVYYLEMNPGLCF